MFYPSKKAVFYQPHCLGNAREGFRFISPTCHCPHPRDHRQSRPCYVPALHRGNQPLGSRTQGVMYLPKNTFSAIQGVQLTLWLHPLTPVPGICPCCNWLSCPWSLHCCIQLQWLHSQPQALKMETCVIGIVICRFETDLFIFERFQMSF